MLLIIVLLFNAINCFMEINTPSCIWFNNTCVDACPEKMIMAEINCSYSNWPAIRTCQSPAPSWVGTQCGHFRCECPREQLLDLETGYCYDEDSCPFQHVYI